MFGESNIVDEISTHAPAWGATAENQPIDLAAAIFQPTPPRGGRRVPESVLPSIKHFNPRPRVGGDTAITPLMLAGRIFQPTPPRGGRLLARRFRWTAETKFQPTPPRGGRRFLGHQVPGYLCISTHAPAWGATLRSASSGISVRISTHAPAWGATPAHPGQGCRRGISTHAPAWGATVRLPSWTPETTRFQPTPPRGGRRLRSAC